MASASGGESRRFQHPKRYRRSLSPQHSALSTIPMRDKRPVDELSIEELERILAIKKREERQRRMQRMQRDGRVLAKDSTVEPTLPVVVQPLTPGATSGSAPSPTKRSDGREERDSEAEQQVISNEPEPPKAE